jgi:hypothetical protein
MIRPAIAGLLMVALAGCTVVPVYKAPANADHARVHLSDDNSASLWMCLDNTRYRLAQDSTGFAKIPSGRRLTVGVWFYNYVYNGVTTSCEAASSFIPQTGGSYYVDFEIENESCTALAYREGAANRIGLEFEPTLQPPATACFMN